MGSAESLHVRSRAKRALGDGLVQWVSNFYVCNLCKGTPICSTLHSLKSMNLLGGMRSWGGGSEGHCQKQVTKCFLTLRSTWFLQYLDGYLISLLKSFLKISGHTHHNYPPRKNTLAPLASTSTHPRRQLPVGGSPRPGSVHLGSPIGPPLFLP